jgi:Pvc16 N-terminal domain/Carboxypeptidase regulatory-like domain
MINDLSRTLKYLLHSVAENEPQMFPLLQGKEIEFARPDKDYKPKASGSVCLFLYDIRENRELRSNEPLRITQNGQPAIARPPTRVVCSYLITAWPAEAVGGDDLNLLEHQLLSEVLQLLSRYSTIPANALQGKLADPEQPVPLPMITAQAEGLNNISEFWTAIGSNLRPSLNVKATFAMQVSQPKAEAKPPVERILREDKPVKLEINGLVNDDNYVPIAGARIAIVELGLSTTSDSNGQYAFSAIPIGIYNLRINWKAGEKLERRNLQITVPGVPLAGQLKDDQGKPVAGATITISQLNLSKTSDSQGQYSFGLVPLGKYHLQVKWTVSGNQKSKDVEVTVPAVAGAYDLELKG